ncbi:MAG TPA: sn-glycerol-3-phosphate ABC transporter substrate-binding protein UgpB, partial [Deltaproteobacteria bacterium]|nr:sn-glycerol-3-phosphate ABC transporter substrate-binding protein UgpB [Deltaproteobacteria bacterium]
MRKILVLISAVIAIVFLSGQVMAEPITINWWHAMKGARGKVIDTMVKAFNDSQSEYVVVATYKGDYDETVNAGVAAYRAKKQPHILQSFEVGTQTM